MSRIIDVKIEEDVLFREGFRISALSDMLDEFLLMEIEEPTIRAFSDPDHWNPEHYVIRLQSPSFKNVEDGQNIPSVYPIFEKDEHDDHIIKGFLGLKDCLEPLDKSEATFRMYKGNGIYVEAPIKGNESVYESYLKDDVLVMESYDKKTNEHKITIYDHLLYSGAINFEAINHLVTPTKYRGRPIVNHLKEMSDKLNKSIRLEPKELPPVVLKYDLDRNWGIWPDSNWQNAASKVDMNAAGNWVKDLTGDISLPATIDLNELHRAIAEGMAEAVKNHPDNFKSECSHVWQRYNGAMKSFDYCSKDGCKYNRDDDGRIWKS